MTSVLWLLALGLFAVVAISAAASWRTRRKRLARIRAGWGQPQIRERRLVAIAEYFRSRASTADSETFLDEPTWDDLNVDAVFEQGELVDYLADDYDAFHFGNELASKALMFDYRLQPGVTRSRNALAPLELQGAPAPMITRAIERAAVLDRIRSVPPSR